MPKSIKLFWWSEPILQKKPFENYGDLLGKYLVEKISGREVIFSKPQRRSLFSFFQPIYVTVGSILAHINRHCIVWGSGIIRKDQKVNNAKFLAVRGPETRNNLLTQGYMVPEVYGDPALLLPLYFNPDLEKIYDIGIVLHYSDYDNLYSEIKDNKDLTLIDLKTNNIEDKTKEILTCKRIVSSSLHGVIVAHAYGIPAIWVKPSNNLYGDDIKFKDYFLSVELDPYQAHISIQQINDLKHLNSLFYTYNSLPESEIIRSLQKNLMAVCPFV